ncbi:MAG TPA: calcium:proton antiporter [Burkholderiaceae bacterium]
MREWPLALAAVALAVSWPLEHAVLAAGRAASLAAAAALVALILLAAVRVAHHAEELAERLGEPYGTMVLTLSAVLVEVVVLAIVMSQSPSPTLARDTIYSAVMLDINALLGLAALLGGLRHGEQPYNVDSGNTYVVMILTGLGVSMVLPGFVPAPHWQGYAIFTIVVMILLYGLFLRLQTGRHSYFFSYSYAQKAAPEATPPDAVADRVHVGGRAGPAAGIAVGIVLIGLLSEVMAATLEAGLEGSGAPGIVAPLLVALISASPEILTALRAALGNRMQPVVNIALGASLSTVVLTVPVILALALATHHPITMALTVPQAVMVFLTLLVATINIHDGETNAIEGLTHFVLFAAFLMLSAVGV